MKLYKRKFFITLLVVGVMIIDASLLEGQGFQSFYVQIGGLMVSIYLIVVAMEWLSAKLS